MKSVNNQNGFTLISMMIGAAMGLIVLGGMTNLVISQSRSVTRIQGKMENHRLGQVLRRSLANTASCNCFLQDPDIRSALLSGGVSQLDRLALSGWDHNTQACNSSSVAIAERYQPLATGIASMPVSHIEISQGPVMAHLTEVSVIAGSGPHHTAGTLRQAIIEIGFDYNRLPASEQSDTLEQVQSHEPIHIQFSYINAGSQLFCEDKSRIVDNAVARNQRFVWKQQVLKDIAKKYIEASYRGVETVGDPLLYQDADNLAFNFAADGHVNHLVVLTDDERDLVGLPPDTKSFIDTDFKNTLESAEQVFRGLAYLGGAPRPPDDLVPLYNSGQYDFINGWGVGSPIAGFPSAPNPDAPFSRLGPDQSWDLRGQPWNDIRDPVPFVAFSFQDNLENTVGPAQVLRMGQLASPIADEANARAQQIQNDLQAHELQEQGRVVASAQQSQNSIQQNTITLRNEVTSHSAQTVNELQNYSDNTYDIFLKSGTRPDDMERTWEDFANKWGFNVNYP